MNILLHGFGFTDLILFATRFMIGFFFISYRFRFIWDPASSPHLCNITRQQKLEQKLMHCGYSGAWAMAAFIAGAEIAASLSLIGGLFTVGGAVGILLILLAATYCTGREKTMRQNPIDKIDVVNCYLWNPEPVYIALTLVVLSFGPGAFSLDYLISLFL